MHPDSFKVELAEILIDAAEQSNIDLTGKEQMVTQAAKAGGALYQTTKGDLRTSLIILGELLLPFLESIPPQEKAHPNILCVPLYALTNTTKTVNRMLQRVWREKYSGHPLLDHLRNIVRDGAEKANAPHQSYKGDRAHYHYLPQPIAKLFETKVYWITERGRHAHHWITGNPGTGKTNLIKWWLDFDLKEAAQERCSVIVIDNKDLISQLRQYQIFAPGEPLHGKLTIIDGRDAIALNPFHIPGIGLQVAVYMLEGLADGAAPQEDAFYWIARAANQSDERNFHTVRDIIDMHGQKGKPTPHWDMDEETERWFATNFHELNSQSVAAMSRKMGRLFEHAQFVRMFNEEGFHFNMAKMEPGEALLIDASRRVFGDDGSSLLGRLFIKLLDELSEYRTKPGVPRWPIHTYIDEASSYVSHDKNFISVLDRSRAMQIAMTTSNQADDTSQMSASVLSALKRCNIKSTCIRFIRSPGEFQTAAYNQEPIHFHTNHLFENKLMSMSQYELMREAMKKPEAKKVDKKKRDDRNVL